MWRIRLQTQKQELVHETSEIRGYAPTDYGLEDFAISATNDMPGQEAQILVKFKLQVDLRSWQENIFKFYTPEGFHFRCGTLVTSEKEIVPQEALLPTDASPYINIIQNLEIPPGANPDSYIAADGRPIVHCTLNVMTLAVSYTDDLSERRYAFATTVINAPVAPIPNLWRLEVLMNGNIVEGGAAGGYELAPPPPPPGSEDQTDGLIDGESSGSHSLRMSIVWTLDLLLLRLAVSTLCFSLHY
jgi:hypothetical protein